MTFINFTFSLCWLLSSLGVIVFNILEYFEIGHKFRKERIEVYEECSDLSLALMWIFFFLMVVTNMNMK